MKNLRNVFLVLVISLLSINSFAQSDVAGDWIVGKQNTVVKIEKDNGLYIGKIISSDNPDAEIGKLLVKELKEEKDTWEGQIYAPKRKEWYEAEFLRIGDMLKIEITVGFFSKTVEWIKK